jgi:hypothetical protein
MWWPRREGAEDENVQREQRTQISSTWWLNWFKLLVGIYGHSGCWRILWRPSKHCTLRSCTHVRITLLCNWSESTKLLAAYHLICALIQCKLSNYLSFQYCTSFTFPFWSLRFSFLYGIGLAGLSSARHRIISLFTKMMVT